MFPLKKRTGFKREFGFDTEATEECPVAKCMTELLGLFSFKGLF
ncbi:MAG: hypothetical protein OXB86_00150 [Bdellovibrionales bacterium]|nr:hypothetical protein [Bdellovibrionales bacterium]